ncbi:GntR family transcriptional regulator [Clostridium sp.]|uniref:GntR family transcriptional regulator n=1 Tax=Clostridium sp. TaxID=1506 RepID=UPI003F34DB8D
MVLRIDFDSEIAIYMQIKNEIIKGIAKREIEEGDELPSVRALAEDIGVNMHTVNKAYTLLKDDGYIKIDRRKGAVISLSLNQSNDKFKMDIEDKLKYYMAECFNRGISKEKVKEKIDKCFSEFYLED